MRTSALRLHERGRRWSRLCECASLRMREAKRRLSRDSTAYAGGAMYTRIVSFTLKPNASPAFMNLIEQKFLPTLRNESGFQDLMVFVVPGGPEVIAMSIWDGREDADNYVRTSYREVLRVLEPLIENKPE